MRWFARYMLLIAMGTACTAPVGAAHAPTDPLPALLPSVPPHALAADVCASSPQTLPSRRLRRLSVTELENTLTFLTDGNFVLGRSLTGDSRVNGYDNGVSALGVAGSQFDEFVAMGDRAAGQVRANVARFAPCPDSAGSLLCGDQFAARFGERAYGRPLTADERQRLAVVYAVGSEDEGHAGGVELVAQAILQSPHFLYRTELGPATLEEDTALSPGDRITLAPHEVASRLSFLLTGARPDDELRAVATRLADPVERARQARRLLKFPAARGQIRRFVKAWLEVTDVAMISKELGAFPEFTRTMRLSLDHEINAFVDRQMGPSGAGLPGLLTDPSGYVDATLAPVYGQDVAGPPDADGRVPLRPERRKGILSLAGFLARHANVDATNPIERGLAVRTRLFCQDIPGPPPGAASARPIDVGDRQTTTRDKYRAHSDDVACRGCHQLLDPIGFGLEAFDPIGRYRSTEGGLPIDATGQLAGTDVDGPFTGPAQLADRLAMSDEVRGCFVAQLSEFAEGVAVAADQPCEQRQLVKELAQHDGKIDDLLVAMVSRPSFIQRQQAAP